MAETVGFYWAKEKEQDYTTIILFHRRLPKNKRTDGPAFHRFLEKESFQTGRKNTDRDLDAHFHFLSQADLLPPGLLGFSSDLSRFFSGVPSSTDLIPPLKFLMALPNPEPISGNRLAPKMRKTIARMTTSSCVPSPNNLLTPPCAFFREQYIPASGFNQVQNSVGEETRPKGKDALSLITPEWKKDRSLLGGWKKVGFISPPGPWIRPHGRYIFYSGILCIAIIGFSSKGGNSSDFISGGIEGDLKFDALGGVAPF